MPIYIIIKYDITGLIDIYVQKKPHTTKAIKKDSVQSIKGIEPITNQVFNLNIKRINIYSFKLQTNSFNDYFMMLIMLTL